MKKDDLDTLCSPEMSRRAFMAIIVGSLLAAPLAAEAQQAGKAPRVAYLSASSAATATGESKPFGKDCASSVMSRDRTS